MVPSTSIETSSEKNPNALSRCDVWPRSSSPKHCVLNLRKFRAHTEHIRSPFIRVQETVVLVSQNPSLIRELAYCGRGILLRVSEATNHLRMVHLHFIPENISML